jgi:hypothetical protein
LNLKAVNESKLDENRFKELNVYTKELDGYILACQSMLKIEFENELAKLSDQLNQNTRQIMSKILLVENADKNEFKVINFKHIYCVLTTS